jgi:acyl carrier protein
MHRPDVQRQRRGGDALTRPTGFARHRRYIDRLSKGTLVGHTAEVIRSFIAAELASDGPAVDLDTPLVSGEVLDSMAILELVGFLEEEFEIVLAAADVTVDNFETVERIARLVETKSGG